MSRYNLPKFARYIPLWQQRIPQYPLYWKGNPQLRVFLPLFWMKLRNADGKLPATRVLFEVHPQMTTYDVKNYLEKIYKVPVLSVSMELMKGEERKGVRGGSIQPEDNYKLATIQLDNKATFTFPDFYKENKSEQDKSVEEFVDMQKKTDHEAEKTWHRTDLPPWFR